MAKIAMACLLLFSASLFFFQNIRIFTEYVYLPGSDVVDEVRHHYGSFRSDFTSGNIPLIILAVMFLLGVIAVCAYITYLITKSEERHYHRAEKFDIPYKVLYSLVIVYIGIRGFFTFPYLEAPNGIVIASIIGALLNWFIPKVRYDNSF